MIRKTVWHCHPQSLISLCSWPLTRLRPHSGPPLQSHRIANMEGGLKPKPPVPWVIAPFERCSRTRIRFTDASEPAEAFRTKGLNHSSNITLILPTFDLLLFWGEWLRHYTDSYFFFITCLNRSGSNPGHFVCQTSLSVNWPPRWLANNCYKKLLTLNIRLHPIP